MADLHVAKLWRSGHTIFLNSGVKARKKGRDIDGKSGLWMVKRGRVKDGKKGKGYGWISW